METYIGFAEVYDTFMDNVPYEEWGEYLDKLLAEYQIEDGPILELGCGTGSMTEILALKGYDMIGVDQSAEMLSIAMNKRLLSGHDILYLKQDMRELELYGRVAAAVSVCDSINYILEPEELIEVFRRVNEYLEPQGIFIFDFNTEYKYNMVLGDQVIAENREECSFIWDNLYDAKERINEYVLTLFIKEEGELYRKHEEVHYQRAYTLEEIKAMVKTAGLEYLGAYDGADAGKVHEQSERIFVIARESGKGDESKL